MYFTTIDQTITKKGRKDKKWEIDLYKMKNEYKGLLRRTFKDMESMRIKDTLYEQDENDPKKARLKYYIAECDITNELARMFTEGKLKLREPKKTDREFQYVHFTKWVDVQDITGKWRRKSKDVMAFDEDKYNKAVKQWKEDHEKASYYKDMRLGDLEILKESSPLVYTTSRFFTETETWEHLIYKDLFDVHAFNEFFKKSEAANLLYINVITSKIEEANRENRRKIALRAFHKYKVGNSFLIKNNGDINENELVTTIRNCRKVLKNIKWREENNYFVTVQGLMRVFIYACEQNDTITADNFWQLIVGTKKIKPMIEDPSEISMDDWRTNNGRSVIDKFPPSTIKNLKKGKVKTALKDLLIGDHGWTLSGTYLARTLQPPKKKKSQALKF